MPPRIGQRTPGSSDLAECVAQHSSTWFCQVALNTFALRAFALVLCLNLFLNFMLKHLYQVLCRTSCFFLPSPSLCIAEVVLTRLVFENLLLRWEILGLTQRVMRSAKLLWCVHVARSTPSTPYYFFNSDSTPSFVGKKHLLFPKGITFAFL